MATPTVDARPARAGSEREMVSRTEQADRPADCGEQGELDGLRVKELLDFLKPKEGRSYELNTFGVEALRIARGEGDGQ